MEKIPDWFAIQKERKGYGEKTNIKAMKERIPRQVRYRSFKEDKLRQQNTWPLVLSLLLLFSRYESNSLVVAT